MSTRFVCTQKNINKFSSFFRTEIAPLFAKPIGKVLRIGETEQFNNIRCLLIDDWLYVFSSHHTKQQGNPTPKHRYVTRLAHKKINLPFLILTDLCERLVNMDLVTNTLAINNKNLRTFSCWGTHSITIKGITTLADCKHLRDLDLGWCFIQRDLGNKLTELSIGCPKLVRLILAGWHFVNDDNLIPLIKNCRYIQQLDLLGAKNISENVCEKALEWLTDLQLLDVSFCKRIGLKTVIMTGGSACVCKRFVFFRSKAGVRHIRMLRYKNASTLPKIACWSLGIRRSNARDDCASPDKLKDDRRNQTRRIRLPFSYQFVHIFGNGGCRCRQNFTAGFIENRRGFERKFM